MTKQTSLSGLRVTVLYNKPAARFAADAKHIVAEEDTEESAQEIASALKSKGMIPALAPITEHDSKKVIENLPDDLVFNLIEWTGIDTPYAIQAYEYMHAKELSYTGAALDTYLLSCDKSVMKARLESAHLPTARWQLFKTGDETVRDDFHYPLIVKVSSEHSSVGLTKEAIVHNAEDAKTMVKKRLIEYRQPVYIEEFLTGREFQVTLLERESGLSVLPISEVQYTKKTDVPFLTYNSRWDATHHDYNNSLVLLAQLTASLEKKIHDMSVTAFRTFGYRDYARFDIRCQAESPMFLEINSNPGLSDDEEYGMTVSYKAVGMTFADVVEEIVRSALRRKERTGVTG